MGWRITKEHIVQRCFDAPAVTSTVAPREVVGWKGTLTGRFSRLRRHFPGEHAASKPCPAAAALPPHPIADAGEHGFGELPRARAGRSTVKE
eukprot:gene34598-52342_t